MNRNQPESNRGWSRGYFFGGMIALAVGLLPSLAIAGILVGTGDGNDQAADVLDVVNDYNTANDPDLPTVFDLFKKTDDDAAFVFNMANGFMFFSDAAGTVPVLSAGALHSLQTAYFKYTGPEQLVYYSVKGGPDFDLYTFMPGLNFMQPPLLGNGNIPEISHVSFWSIPGGVVPEPTTLVLLAGAGAIWAASRRRR